MIKIKKINDKTLRRDDGLWSAGRDGGAHTGVLIKAFTISRLSCQVGLDHSKHGQVLNIELIIDYHFIDY